MGYPLKIIIQSLLISFAIHLIYISGVLTLGYLETRNYQPNIDKSWNNVLVLQDEVAFGVEGSPFILMYTYIGIALISGLVLIIYRKAKKDASPTVG